VPVAHRADVAADVEAVREATAQKLGAQRKQRKSDSREPPLSLPIVHAESVPAG
jgi:hypothetical protein